MRDSVFQKVRWRMTVKTLAAAQMQILCATIDEWAILRCAYFGLIDNHYPKHPLLHFMLLHPVIFSKADG